MLKYMHLHLSRWKRLDKELTISVEKFVTAFVSPSLIKLETRLQKKPDETLTVGASNFASWREIWRVGFVQHGREANAIIGN